MRERLFSLFALTILFFSFVLSGCAVHSSSFPAVKNGVLDASRWNFTTQGPIKLNGEWKFYWKQFTMDIPNASPSQNQDHTIMVPSIWNSKKINGISLPGQGYATYTITVQFNPAEKNSTKALYIPTISSAYRLYINGKLAASAGTIGKTAQEMKPQSLSQVVYFQPKEERVTLTFHIANFVHKKGGIRIAILLGDDKQITNLRQKNLIFNAALSSCLLIAGLYHFVLYALRRTNKSPLYFGLFCLCIGIRSLITGGDEILTALFPNFDWGISLKAEYLGFYLALPAFVMFLHSVYPEDFPHPFIRLTQILGGSFSLLTLTTTSVFHSTAITWFYPVMLACISYILFLLFLVALRKREFAMLNVSVATIFLLTAINDILYHSQMVKIGNLTPFGLFLFVFVQSFTISVKSARAFANVERMSIQLKNLNNTLEEKVRERTQKLEHSLQEMAAARSEMSALAERNRIAGEIHDIVGHTLTTIIVQIEAGKRLIGKNLPLAIEKLELAQELVRNGLNEIRRTVRMIKEDTLIFDLLAELKELIHVTEKHAGIEIEYTIFPLPDLNLSQKKFLYHALQEGLTNGIRHGKSTHFTFILKEENETIVFLLKDNGQGCENITYGFGLKTMESRAAEINGTLSVISQPNQGCQLTISFPL